MKTMKLWRIAFMMLALVSMTGLAQEIKMNETAISDYIPLLNAKGYQAYSFDVSAIKGRNVEIYCREFVNRKEVEDSPRLLFPYYFEAKGRQTDYRLSSFRNRFISPILFQLGEHAFLPFLVETQANLLGE